MSVQAGYPGVYIQEVPSGVRTITSASTSTLAMLGHFARGPLGGPAMRLNNWGDAERIFGGLDSRCEASYALQEFFQQGGSTAYVVRVGFTQAEIVLTAAVPAMTVTARAGGPGGNTIAVGFSHNPDGSFDMVVSPSAASHADRRTYTGLTATPGSQGFAEARVNAPEAQGGSPLVTVSNVAQMPAATVPGTAAGDLARADLVPLANGVALASASLALPNGNPRITATAIASGVAGNAVRIALRHNGATNFDLLVRADAMSAPELFEDLSMVALDPRFVEGVVNTGAGGGAASALLTIGGTNGLRPAQQLPPAFPPASPLTDIQYADMVPLAGGLAVASASAALISGPQPALTLQAFAPGAGGNALTVAVADQGGGWFRLTFAGLAPGSVFDNLTIDPTSADYVVARLAGSGVAAVVTGRHQLLTPTVAAATAFAGGGAPVPTASAAFMTAAAAPALTVSAANPGAWGNSLRIGIGAAAGGAFDLVVTEFLGEDPVRSEAYRNLNAIPGDRNNAVDVIAQQSGLIRITNLQAIPAASVTDVDADDLARLEMVPLTGGADGVMPGDPAWQAAAPAAFAGSEATSTGMRALDRIVPEIFNLMSVPEAAQMADPGAFYGVAGAYCDANLAFLLVDHPTLNDDAARITDWDIAGALGTNLARSAALCFPKIVRPDPLASNRPRALPASGSIAGVMARTDAQRGVWKAPAGLDASLSGVTPSVVLTDLEQGRLNKRGLNALRVFPNAGTVNWGARTLAGADALASEWKYVPVRRTALFIERSLKTALPWVVFEPNDEPLWAQIRLNVGAFMQGLFVQGAFEGRTPRDAYLVRCDGETTSQQDVNAGIVNILVGFAPLKPAEFVVIRLRQLAGRLAA